MLNGIKHLWLAIVLIAAAMVVLLFSDSQRRNGVRESSPKNALPNVAIMQFSSTPLLDAHVAGVKDSLRKHRLLADDEHNLRIFNPQADFPTANAVARQMVQGNYDILITSSTVALQITAKANLNTKVTHVFGAVTSPQGAGVGVTGTNADDHPPWLAGIGTFQPVQRAFGIAHELNPSIQKVGVVWNPGEQCSEACTAEAKIACKQLGIELIEAVATQSGEVNDAIRSLLGKNVEAVWIGGDTVANAAAAMIIHIASTQ
jgi:putative ABC transport system substrate-binding protein